MGSTKDVSCDFICEWFDFLRTWIPDQSDINGHNVDDDDDYDYDCEIKSDKNPSNQKIPVTITSFNCDANYLFFGTNHGWVYCFSRGEKQAKGPLFERHPVKSSIIKIEIPDENCIFLLLPDSFVLFNFKLNQLIYSWSLQKPLDEPGSPKLVAIKSIFDESRRRYWVFTGDSIGQLRCHKITEDEHEIIFKEDPVENNGNHHHKIVQIDLFNPELLAVSTCFRSVILWKSVSDSWAPIPIGRNVRKLCGQYGAVFHTDGNIVLAARPSMHLIKANTTDGCVFETFKLKNAKPTRNLNLFREPISQSEASSKQPSPASPNFNLGFLLNVRINNEDFICSWSDYSLSIVKLDGTLLVKENSSKKIVSANVSYSHGFTDIIILRDDRCMFRIRFIVNKGYKSRLTESGLSEIFKGTLLSENSLGEILKGTVLPENGIGELLKGSISSQNLRNLPSQAYSSLGGEFKKIYSIMQDKFYVSGERLFSYASLENLNVLQRSSSFDSQTALEKDEQGDKKNSSEPYNSDILDDLNNTDSPLFVHKKAQRKNSKRNSRYEETIIVDKTNQFSSDQYDITRSSNSSSLSNIPSVISEDSTNNNLPCSSDEQITESEFCPEPEPEFESVTELETEAFKPIDTMDLAGLDVVQKFNRSDSVNNNQQRQHDTIKSSDIFSLAAINRLDWPKTSSQFSLKETPNLNKSSAEKSTEITSKSLNEHLAQNQYLIDCQTAMRLDWQLAIENTPGQLTINYLCASAFIDQEKDSFVWLSCFHKDKPKLVYYPDFESLRLPQAQGQSPKVGALPGKILLLYEDGELWFREGIDEPPGLAIGPLGTFVSKWTKLSTPRFSRNLSSISMCSKDSIGWFSDAKGNAWLLKLQSNSWSKISHDSENKFYIKDISVCPTESSMVWAIDQLCNLYVRVGIFNTKGDKDEHIGGMSWLPVQTPTQVASVAVTQNSVWILSKDSNRIFKRLGIQPPSSYVGIGWQEIKPPTLVKDSLKTVSASLNGDIWLLSELGFVWQHCDPETSLTSNIFN